MGNNVKGPGGQVTTTIKKYTMDLKIRMSLMDLVRIVLVEWQR